MKTTSKMVNSETITITVNDVVYTVNTSGVSPQSTLNGYLRNTLHLTGTKNMCLEGGCGTCTVAIEETDVDGKSTFYSLNSCLVSLLSCDGWKVHTVEGIGNPLIGYHKIQTTLSDNYGTQCGFCSSGMVMNMYALQQSGPKTQKEIENSFGGNLCRCTGYRPILYAFKTLASDSDKNKVADIEDLKVCPSTGKTCTNKCKSKKTEIFNLGATTWVQVSSIDELLTTLKTSTTTNYMLVSGNTAKGIFKDAARPDLYIDIQNVAELTTYSLENGSLTVGGNVTLTQLMVICKENSSAVNFSFLDTIEQHLDLVATVQIRNMGSLAGNLMMKHQYNEFPSDVFVLLQTFNATLIIVDVDGNETLSSPKDFLVMDMTKKVIKNIVMKALDDSYIFSSYKIMSRAQNVAAMVNAGFLLQLNDENVVKSARIVYGGINSSFIHATNTEESLVGQPLYDNSTLQRAFKLLNAELVPDSVQPGYSSEYRKKLAISLFYKFVLKTCPDNLVADEYKSGGSLLDRPLSTGVQDYTTNEDLWPLTQPIPKVEALAQCSGQAEYIMDMPLRPNEVFCTFVTAEAPAGSTITTIDASAALAVDGVVAFYGKDDIPGLNTFTPTDVSVFSVEEELFCSGTVQYYHQPVGVIVATSQFTAYRAAKLVNVAYSGPTTKPYLYVKDVVDDNVTDRITLNTTVTRTSTGNDVKHVVSGEFYLGQQYHFHMEVQCCKVVPTEDGIDIFPATQWMDGTQLGAATVLGIPTNKINVKVRRLGGGFGGKMVRSGLISSATALAAFKLRRPVTMIMSFEQNMEIVGKRYPLYMQYETGVNDAGVIQYLDAKLYADMGIGGNEPHDSLLVASFTNCYDSSTFGFTTYAVKTDTAANCYTRAPGTLESTAAIESILDHVAATLDLDPFDVRLANISSPEIPAYWTDLQSWADIATRKTEIAAFNKANRWKKKGISITPLKWDLEVEANYSVLVSVYHGDGSVAVSHGGVEMGQGINTKVAQVCAHKLGIPLEKVSVKPSYNFVAPNSTSTGGSLTSEAVCYAVITACDKILARLSPIREQMTDPTWEELVKQSFEDSIQLNATGFYYGTAPGIQIYSVYGICAATVEVDLLTGKHEILQVDIIEDLGQSMSPLVDIGQIEGAFIMGTGYHLTEEMKYNEDGKLLTNRTWYYKPPTAKDIPINFRVKFTENSTNSVGVLKSKAVAEPPLCLAISVPLAIRNALAYARQTADSTKTKWISIDGPTTVEKTFLYALNDFTQYKLN